MGHYMVFPASCESDLKLGRVFAVATGQVNCYNCTVRLLSIPALRRRSVRGSSVASTTGLPGEYAPLFMFTFRTKSSQHLHVCTLHTRRRINGLSSNSAMTTSLVTK